MPPSSQASVGTTGTIILVEDYDALGAAFGSTLRKLAQSHDTVVVRSFADAEIAAAASSPNLFVVDFDPPQSGAVVFFRRMKAAHADARVLVIAANTWPELAHERIRPGAFQFIEKPFELGKFRAVVHAQLTSGEDSGAVSTIGGLRDLDLTDMIALLGGAAATTILKVSAAAGQAGEVHFFGGQITQAVGMGKVGTFALEEMLRWSSPRFVESKMHGDRPPTMRRPWTTVLSEALRARRLVEPSPKESRNILPDAPPPEKKIVVVDDTELLLIFLQEILRTTRPPFEVVTALSGMEGLKLTAEVLPDLVLLDYSLPDVAGDEVCRRLLEDARTAQIPVIMMSGHVAEMATTAQRFRNVVATIAKPFLSAALIDLVEQTLTNQPALTVTPPQSAPRRPVKKIRKAPLKRKAPKIAAETQVIPSSPTPSNSIPAVAVPKSPASEPKERDHGVRSIAEPENPSSDPEPMASFSEDEPASESTVSIEPLQDIAAVPADPPRNHFSALESPPVTPLTSHESSPPREAPIEPGAVADTPAISGRRVAPARIPEAKNSTVVLALPLVITSIQFSPSLQTKAIRAKPSSSMVSVHIHTEDVSQVEVRATAFELDQVDLDARGQIRTVRLAPCVRPISTPEPGGSLAVAEVAVFPENGNGTIQLTPFAVNPMRIQLLALFELTAVEFTAPFSIEYLVLKTRGAKVRVNLPSGATNTGITFRTVQILLARSGRIAEVLLDELD